MKRQTSSTQKVLNIWAIILIVWSIYRAKVSLPVWFDEFVAKPLVFVLPVYFYITRSEKKNFLAGIWLQKKNAFNDIIIGIAIGSCFLLSAVASSYLKHGGFSGATYGNITLLSFGAMLITSLATGATEEILSRGFILKRLYEDSKNPITSVFTSSMLFFLIHIPILFTMPHLNGNLLMLFMATDLILSISNSFLFLTRKNIILPILIHAFYNLAITFYL
jgi:membrane protease YdiL (CAAX protease family)